eukprot:TRINITY_DN9447_c0_g1_i1.p1 TRINITY_DN9447_c0_g1~~TRINITY_DN9447_c0_g1_i1.p1  ORF type:complete len:239 (+),score=33.17 TRINITY_DN9447_c0_g1_i1:181-897(+)
MLGLWTLRAWRFPLTTAPTVSVRGIHLLGKAHSNDERRAPPPPPLKMPPRYGGKTMFPDFDTIVQRDRMLKESPESVKKIWNEYHKQFGKPHAAWSVTDYEKFSARSKESPLFVYPVTKETGFITVFQECRPPELFFTTLEQYRRLGPYSLPLFRLRMYNDLATEKGVVLLRGELPHGYLGYVDATYLIQALHWCYVSNDALYSFVWNFNHRPNEFNFSQFSRMLPRPAPVSPIIKPN